MSQLLTRNQLAMAPSLLRRHSVTLSRLTMNRFLQIFTRRKWHLRPPHRPFYLVLCRSCNIPSQVSPKSHFFPVLLIRGNPSAFIRFIGIGSPVRAISHGERGPVKTREGFTRLGFKFFSRWGHYTLRGGYKQRTRSVAMELE